MRKKENMAPNAISKKMLLSWSLEELTNNLVVLTEDYYDAESATVLFFDRRLGNSLQNPIGELPSQEVLKLYKHCVEETDRDWGEHVVEDGILTVVSIFYGDEPIGCVGWVKAGFDVIDEMEKLNFEWILCIVGAAYSRLSARRGNEKRTRKHLPLLNNKIQFHQESNDELALIIRFDGRIEWQSQWVIDSHKQMPEDIFTNIEELFPDNRDQIAIALSRVQVNGFEHAQGLSLLGDDKMKYNCKFSKELWNGKQCLFVTISPAMSIVDMYELYKHAFELTNVSFVIVSSNNLDVMDCNLQFTKELNLDKLVLASTNFIELLDPKWKNHFRLDDQQDYYQVFNKIESIKFGNSNFQYGFRCHEIHYNGKACLLVAFHPDTKSVPSLS